LGLDFGSEYKNFGLLGLDFGFGFKKFWVLGLGLGIYNQHITQTQTQFFGGINVCPGSKIYFHYSKMISKKFHDV